MYTNADCTVFNKRLDNATRMDVWERTVIRGVYWEDTDGVKKLVSSGITDDSNVLVMIPASADTGGKIYVKPNAYKSSHENTFTLAPGDIIIKGVINSELSTVKELQRTHDDYHVIEKCMDYMYGGLPHFEVTGK